MCSRGQVHPHGQPTPAAAAQPAGDAAEGVGSLSTLQVSQSSGHIGTESVATPGNTVVLTVA